MSETTPYKSKHTRWDQPPSEVYSHDFNGILRIDLYQDHYSWKFISTDKGNTISLKVGEVVVDHDNCNARP